MRYSITLVTGWLVFLLVLVHGCRDSGPKGQQPDPAVLKAEKPLIDSAKVIELLDLYRATRYEDLQSAYAAGPEQVYKISFYGRRMGSLSPEISRFPYLATLDVAGNDLTELPAEIARLHYLQGFYANGNRLTEFPRQLLLLPLLARLNLSGNQITEVPPEIIKMDQLDYLNLEKNRIMKIPVQLYGLNHLTALNLAQNGLSEIPEGISQLSSLRKLDLANNQLTALPREIASMGETLTDLAIQGNQIPEEEIRWLIDAMPLTKIRY
jgi:hypothetical protein